MNMLVPVSNAKHSKNEKYIPGWPWTQSFCSERKEKWRKTETTLTFPWESLYLAQGFDNALVLLRVLNGLVRSLQNAGAWYMALGSDIPHTFQRDPQCLSHVVSW